MMEDEAAAGEILPSIVPLCNNLSAWMPITAMMMRQSSNNPLRIFIQINSLKRDDYLKIIIDDSGIDGVC